MTVPYAFRCYIFDDLCCLKTRFRFSCLYEDATVVLFLVTPCSYVGASCIDIVPVKYGLTSSYVKLDMYAYTFTYNHMHIWSDMIM